MVILMSMDPAAIYLPLRNWFHYLNRIEQVSLIRHLIILGILRRHL
jgi:hypothetical protein